MGFIYPANWVTINISEQAAEGERTMASTAPLLLRVVASSVTITHRVGNLVRDIMSKGELGIIDKVCAQSHLSYLWHIF